MPLAYIPRSGDFPPQEALQLVDALNEGLAFLVQAPFPVEQRRGTGLVTNQQNLIASTEGIQGFVAASSASAGMRGPVTTALRGSNGNGTGDFTVLVFAAPRPSATIQMAYCSAGTGVESYFFFNSNDSFTNIPGTAAFTIFDTGVTASGVIDGRPHVFVVRRVGSSLQFWTDGRQVAAVTNTSSVGNAFNSDVFGGYFAAGYGATDPIGLVAAWNRALPDDLLASVGPNPEQLFEPQRIWVPVSSGPSTPVLSAPTVINITATSATPRVTITI